MVLFSFLQMCLSSDSDLFLLNIGLLSLQRSCLCRKCARSRFEITAFAYLPLFFVLYENVPHRVFYSEWIQLTHTLPSICVDIFSFYTYIFPLFSDILQSPCYARVLVIFIWFGCPSLQYLNQRIKPFIQIDHLIRELYSIILFFLVVVCV